MAMAVAMAGTCLAGLIVFYFWPTAVPAANIDWAQYPDVAFLKSMDASGNACPSLHVATAVFSGIWLHHLLRRFGAPLWILILNWAWCIGIVYSALATRQHVAVDVLAGLVLGVPAAGLSLRHRVRRGAQSAKSTARPFDPNQALELAKLLLYLRSACLSLNPLWLSHFTATSSIGRGLDQTLAALRQRRAGLAPCAFDTVDLATFIGEVAGVDAVQLPAHLADFDCRNNRLALLGLTQDGFAEAVRAAIAKYGAQRIGVFLGTSTSGILQTELAYRRRDPVTGALPADFIYRTTHNTFSVADFTRHYFGLTGPAVVVSSACSSSAKVFGSARRMMAAGLIDAAVVGGVDSLCLTTLYGFSSLGLISEQRMPPVRCTTQRHLDR